MKNPRRDRGCLQCWLGIACAVALMTSSTCVKGQLLSIDLSASDFILAAGDSETDPITLTLNNSGSALSVGGLEFFVQTDSSGPKIASLDLVSGTIWDGTGHTLSPLGTSGPHWQGLGVSKTAIDPGTGPDIPTGDSFIATLKFDTVGVAPGTYAFKLFGTAFEGGGTTYDTRYVDDTLDGDPINISIVNGNLTVVPEPNATLVVAGLLLGVAAGVRRWRAAR